MNEGEAQGAPARCEHDEIRDWFAGVHLHLEGEPNFAAGEIIASWSRVARPMVREIPEPDEDELRAHPQEYFQDDRGRWLARAPDVPDEYDGPLGQEPNVILYLDRIVPAARSAGKTFSDREEALAALAHHRSFAPIVASLFPSGREAGARKGVMAHSLVRALVLWSLRGLGLRAAARCVILLDDEFGSGVANPRAATLVRAFQRGGPEALDDRQARQGIEAALITASRRIWTTIGLTPPTALRI